MWLLKSNSQSQIRRLVWGKTSPGPIQSSSNVKQNRKSIKTKDRGKKKQITNENAKHKISYAKEKYKRKHKSQTKMQNTALLSLLKQNRSVTNTNTILKKYNKKHYMEYWASLHQFSPFNKRERKMQNVKNLFMKQSPLNVKLSIKVKIQATKIQNKSTRQIKIFWWSRSELYL